MNKTLDSTLHLGKTAVKNIVNYGTPVRNAIYGKRKIEKVFGKKKTKEQIDNEIQSMGLFKKIGNKSLNLSKGLIALAIFGFEAKAIKDGFTTHDIGTKFSQEIKKDDMGNFMIGETNIEDIEDINFPNSDADHPNLPGIVPYIIAEGERQNNGGENTIIFLINEVGDKIYNTFGYDQSSVLSPNITRSQGVFQIQPQFMVDVLKNFSENEKQDFLNKLAQFKFQKDGESLSQILGCKSHDDFIADYQNGTIKLRSGDEKLSFAIGYLGIRYYYNDQFKRQNNGIDIFEDTAEIYKLYEELGGVADRAKYNPIQQESYLTAVTASYWPTNYPKTKNLSPRQMYANILAFTQGKYELLALPDGVITNQDGTISEYTKKIKKELNIDTNYDENMANICILDFGKRLKEIKRDKIKAKDMIPHILETSFNIQYTAYKSLKKYCSENGKITFSEKIGYDMRKNINEEGKISGYLIKILSDKDFFEKETGGLSYKDFLDKILLPDLYQTVAISVGGHTNIPSNFGKGTLIKKERNTTKRVAVGFDTGMEDEGFDETSYKSIAGDSLTEDITPIIEDVKSTKENVKSTKEDVKPTKEDVKSTKEEVKSTIEDGKSNNILTVKKGDNIYTLLQNKDKEDIKQWIDKNLGEDVIDLKNKDLIPEYILMAFLFDKDGKNKMTYFYDKKGKFRSPFQRLQEGQKIIFKLPSKDKVIETKKRIKFQKRALENYRNNINTKGLKKENYVVYDIKDVSTLLQKLQNHEKNQGLLVNNNEISLFEEKQITITDNMGTNIYERENYDNGIATISGKLDLKKNNNYTITIMDNDGTTQDLEFLIS